MTSEDSIFEIPGLPLTESDTFEVDLETASGSHYRVTWDAASARGTLTRTTANDPVERPLSQPLRRDGETLPLLSFDRIDLGHPTTFVIDVRNDGTPTTRLANASILIKGTAWDTPESDQIRSAKSSSGNQVGTGDVVAVANGIVTNVHPPTACAAQPWGCWIHRPRPHSLDTAPVRWREDKGTAERVCEHGIGHPDPQDAAYWWNTHCQDVTVHGCDGCCGPVPQWAADLLPGR